ncbi:MAG TPA: molybdopterin-dependent oxidoreductase, partial [Dehalococcoidia bacterium]|nr:molybdopterin-dependent oxidoreductase [Dehalococcoidia bacterium]
PLVRRNGQLEPATWDEALDLMAARLEGYRGDSFALLASPNSTNEELYLAQKFARVVMNTNNVDQTSNIQPELTVALERSLGYAAATNPIWELEQAGAILVFNSNLTEEQNVVGVPIKRATKKGAKLVVIDPREVELTRYADLWLRPVPGTELLLLGGILKSILEQELERTEWIEENCEDPATLHYALQAVEIDEVVQATNVSNDAIAEAARLFGGPANGAVVYSLDNIPQELQRDCVLALTDLVLLTGNLGKSGAGIYPMRPGTNEQGAWDVGCVLNRLPGGRPWTDSSIRQSMETAWQCTLPTQRGLEVAAALLAAREKRVKAMLIIGDSANFTNGRLGDALSALPELEFLVVLDTFLSPPAQLADVVLPRLTFAEKDGTYTNLERRIQRLKPAIELKNSQARPESWLICQLAQRMNTPGFEYNSSSEIMDEIARLSPIYAGVSYQRLEKEAVTVFRSRVESPKPNQLLYSEKEYRGIQWPCPSA